MNREQFVIKRAKSYGVPVKRSNLQKSKYIIGRLNGIARKLSQGSSRRDLSKTGNTIHTFIADLYRIANDLEDGKHNQEAQDYRKGALMLMRVRKKWHDAFYAPSPTVMKVSAGYIRAAIVNIERVLVRSRAKARGVPVKGSGLSGLIADAAQARSYFQKIERNQKRGKLPTASQFKTYRKLLRGFMGRAIYREFSSASRTGIDKWMQGGIMKLRLIERVYIPDSLKDNSPEQVAKDWAIDIGKIGDSVDAIARMARHLLNKKREGM